MFKLMSYTFLIVLTVDLLATSGEITVTWTSPVLPKLYSNDSNVNPFGKSVTSEEESWISSLVNIGAMTGPLLYGFIAQKFGRKITLLCIAVLHIISYLTLAFSKTTYLYYISRFIGGMAAGGGDTVLPIYVAEVAQDSNRGMLTVTLNVFYALGDLLPYVIGPYVSIMWLNIILACIPTAFFVSCLLLAPETPYYLINKNKLDQARNSLMILRRQDKKTIEKEIAHIQNAMQHDEHGHFFDLFKSKVYLKALGISLVLIIAQQLSGINAILFYTQEIFEAAGAENIPSEISSIIIGSVSLISSFTAGFFVDNLGRRMLIIISCFGMLITHIAFGIYFYLKESSGVDVKPIFWLPVLSLVIYIVAFNIGIGPLPWTVSSELFPSSVKSFAASMVAFTLWFSSFLVTKFFNDLKLGLGSGETFWLFGGFCLVAGIFTFFFIPETKGKSFEEIQEILK